MANAKAKTIKVTLVKSIFGQLERHRATVRGLGLRRIRDTADPFHELMIWERNSYVPDPDNMVGAMAVPTGVYGSFATGFDTLPGSDRFAADTVAARNLPVGDERTAAYSAIQRRWAEEYMVLSVLCYSTNLVVSGANVKGMNVSALGNHRCFLENTSVSGA